MDWWVYRVVNKYNSLLSLGRVEAEGSRLYSSDKGGV